MADVPQFISAPRIEIANVATANTAFDGSGTITPLVTGAAGGTRILEIVVKAAATSAAGMVNVFISTNSGTTWRLYDSISVTAVTASTTVAPFESSTTYTNLLLRDATYRLGITTTISQSINVIALGGDF